MIKNENIEPIQFWKEDAPCGKLASDYLNKLLFHQRYDACKLITDASENGLGIREIYLDVLQPVQHKIGWLWQNNEINVAQEHFCSATTQLVMSQLYPKLISHNRKGKSMMAVCAPGELHEIGVRMVADFFEMDGWDSYFIGASSPINSIIDMIIDKNISLLAVSATITFNLAPATDLVKAVKNSEAGKIAKILIGGRIFNIAPDVWKQLGADGYALDAETAIYEANSLLMAS